jgi:hypothetical protein
MDLRSPSPADSYTNSPTNVRVRWTRRTIFLHFCYKCASPLDLIFLETQWRGPSVFWVFLWLFLESRERIELSSSVWKTVTLPLCYPDLDVWCLMYDVRIGWTHSRRTSYIKPRTSQSVKSRNRTYIYGFSNQRNDRLCYLDFIEILDFKILDVRLRRLISKI